MNLNNTIKILPNIYLSNNYIINLEFVKNNSITAIILINNYTENSNENNELYDKIYIEISTNINFDNTNDLIVDLIKKSKNILIISDKNLIGFVIVSAFIINNLNTSLFQILLLDRIYNIQISKTNYYNLLCSYYNKKKILM